MHWPRHPLRWRPLPIPWTLPPLRFAPLGLQLLQQTVPRHTAAMRWSPRDLVLRPVPHRACPPPSAASRPSAPVGGHTAEGIAPGTRFPIAVVRWLRVRACVFRHVLACERSCARPHVGACVRAGAVRADGPRPLAGFPSPGCIGLRLQWPGRPRQGRPRSRQLRRPHGRPQRPRILLQGRPLARPFCSPRTWRLGCSPCPYSPSRRGRAPSWQRCSASFFLRQLRRQVRRRQPAFSRRACLRRARHSPPLGPSQ